MTDAIRACDAFTSSEMRKIIWATSRFEDLNLMEQEGNRRAYDTAHAALCKGLYETLFEINRVLFGLPDSLTLFREVLGEEAVEIYRDKSMPFDFLVFFLHHPEKWEDRDNPEDVFGGDGFGDEEEDEEGWDHPESPGFTNESN